MKLSRLAPAAVAALLAQIASLAWAEPVTHTLNFDGLKDAGIPPAKSSSGNVLAGQEKGSLILGYYNNDGREGSQDYGVTLSDKAISACGVPTSQTIKCGADFGKAESGSWAVGNATDDSGFDLTVDPKLFKITSIGFFYNDAGTQSKPGVKITSLQGKSLEVDLTTCANYFECGWRPKSIDDLDNTLGDVTRISFLGMSGAVFFDTIKLTMMSTAPEPPPLPEPSTAALLALGLASMGWAARRRKR